TMDVRPSLLISRDKKRVCSTLLHLRNVVPGLVESFHLELVHDHATGMELVDHHIQVGGVGGIGILNHDELTEFHVQRHACHIHAGQLLIFHVAYKVSK